MNEDVKNAGGAAAAEKSGRGPKRWCVVASGLVEGGRERVIADWGFAAREDAEKRAEALADGWRKAVGAPENASAKAMPEPRKCALAKCRSTDAGTMALVAGTLQDGLDWEAACARHESAELQDCLDLKDLDWEAACAKAGEGWCMLYPAWTPGRRAAVGIGAALVAAGIVACAVLGAAAQAGPAPTAADAPEAAASQTAPAKDEKSAVVLTVEAEGAAEGATKAKVAVTDEGGEVVKEAEVAANEAVELAELEKGDYELLVTEAPVREDGGTYVLPEEAARFSVKGDGEGVSVTVTLDVLEAEDMTKEQLEATAATLEAAGNGEAAQAVKAAAETATSVEGSASAIKRDPAPVPAPGDGSGSSGGSGSGSGGGGQAQPPAAHEHSWTPVTEQQWVSNNVWVVDSAAWDEPVYSYQEVAICAGCGADITANPAGHFIRGGCVNGSPASNWRYEQRRIQTGTVHHDEVGHYEDQGRYETVTVGYRCSCGATR